MLTTRSKTLPRQKHSIFPRKFRDFYRTPQPIISQWLIDNDGGRRCRDRPLGRQSRRAFERVAELLALVIAEHDLVVGDAFNVLGIYRDLAPAPGRVYRELRHRVSRRVAAERSDDLDSLAHIHLEVASAGDEVHLV